MPECCIRIVVPGLVRGISVHTTIEMVVLLEVSGIDGSSPAMLQRRFHTIMRVAG